MRRGRHRRANSPEQKRSIEILLHPWLRYMVNYSTLRLYCTLGHRRSSVVHLDSCESVFSAPRMVSSSLLPSAAAAAVASPNVVPPSKRREVSSDTFVDQIYLSLVNVGANQAVLRGQTGFYTGNVMFRFAFLSVSVGNVSIGSDKGIISPATSSWRR